MSVDSTFDVKPSAFGEASRRAWLHLAINCMPFEAAALLLPDGDVRLLPNLSPEPHRHFIFDPRLLVAWGTPGGLLHSHPLDANGKPQASPSALDMEMQVKSALPWGLSCVGPDGVVGDPIWWGDSLPVRPLLGRTFVHGITDCYALIRDWYRLRGVSLPEFPRDDGWWRNSPGLDLYEHGFTKAGFRVLPEGEWPQEGDVFLCRVLNRVVNHAGVLLGDGWLIHHMAGELSRRVPASRWLGRFDKLLRHESMEVVG